MAQPGGGLVRLKTLVWEHALRYLAGREAVERLEQEVRNSQVSQRLLFHQYRKLAAEGRALNSYDPGFRAYSQADEDGLLLFIFAAIGFTNRVCVDLGAGTPAGGNCTNLISNWGFTGLLVDGDPVNRQQALAFYGRHPDTRIYPPVCTSAWITAENVNDLVRGGGIEGDVDLLSLDLDGVDYWILQALTVVRPRVIVLEFQDLWGPEPSITVPYCPDFVRPDASYDYCGASLGAFVKLCGRRGYRLVGTNRPGQNAFFVSADLVQAVLPEVPAKDCFTNAAALATYPERRRRAILREWQEV